VWRLFLFQLSAALAEPWTYHIWYEDEVRVGWSVVFVDEAAQAEVSDLPADMRAKVERIVMLMREHGLEKVREPYVKHLEDKLWEMRLIGRDGIARTIYVTASGRRIVVLRTFVKKTGKTPKRELELARERAKEVL
jgi:phage-related protein